MMNVEVRDTPIPNGYIPFIILQRREADYYGGGITVLELRRFLEPRLRDHLWTRSGVKTWIKEAEDWKRSWDLEDAEYVPRLLMEYFSIRAMA